MQFMQRYLKSRRLWAGVTMIMAGSLLVMQIVPVSKNNPPVVQEPNWDSQETAQLARAACYDCHSNETVYPWYADFAPMRVLVRNHVNEGRSTLNFSNIQRRVDVNEIVSVIKEGEMPPWDYQLMHPNARLTDSQRSQLADGIIRTFKQG